jgi:hemerythrin-like domain-containing protein
MEQYLNTGIKEVIQRFPKVGEVLGQYGIGCVTCSAGTCLLKDVVQIHGLSKDREAMLMAQIQKFIDPQSHDELPDIPSPSNPNETIKPKYSPPIRVLMEEHKLIKKLLAIIPAICDALTVQIDQQLVNECIDLIRNYADRFHHAKEEEILFCYVDGDSDIVKTMIREHQNGRDFVKSISEGLAAGDVQTITTGFYEYHVLLRQHIQKEDEILYPWIDRNLTTRQVGELAARFNEVNRKFGKEISERFEEFLKTSAVKLKKFKNGGNENG